MDLLFGRVYRARQPRVPGSPSIDAGPHPARLRAAQHHGRVPAARQSLHETLQGRAGPILGTPHWSGNPTPSRRRCQHHPLHCWHAQPHHALDPRRVEGDRHDASQHSSIVRHRVHRCRGSRRHRSRHSAPHCQHALQASPRLFRQRSAQMQTWMKRATSQCTRTHRTCSLIFSKKRTMNPRCLSMRCQSQDAHEEAPVPVLNRFLALRIVHGDGLRRIPSVK